MILMNKKTHCAEQYLQNELMDESVPCDLCSLSLSLFLFASFLAEPERFQQLVKSPPFLPALSCCTALSGGQGGWGGAMWEAGEKVEGE